MEFSEVYALALYSLAAAGLVLAVVRSRRGWQLQVSVLFGLTAVWAVALGLFLSNDAVGHDCTRADHSGEWPSLIATVAWAGVLLAVLAIPNPPVSRLTVRIGLPLLTVALIAATAFILWSFQSTGC